MANLWSVKIRNGKIVLSDFANIPGVGYAKIFFATEKAAIAAFKCQPYTNWSSQIIELPATCSPEQAEMIYQAVKAEVDKGLTHAKKVTGALKAPFWTTTFRGDRIVVQRKDTGALGYCGLFYAIERAVRSALPPGSGAWISWACDIELPVEMTVEQATKIVALVKAEVDEADANADKVVKILEGISLAESKAQQAAKLLSEAMEILRGGSVK